MLFKVYTVAFYIEDYPFRHLQDRSRLGGTNGKSQIQEASEAIALLSPYMGLSSQQLSQSPDFYRLIGSPRLPLDRSLLIKLAMSLKKETLVQGIVKEIRLLPKNAVSKNIFALLDCDVTPLQ